MFTKAQRKKWEVFQEHARLIFAAPMMFVALTYAKECIQEYHALLKSMQTDQEAMGDYEFLLELIDEALNEATGEKHGRAS